jgi:hypothetical protein
MTPFGNVAGHVDVSPGREIHGRCVGIQRIQGSLLVVRVLLVNPVCNRGWGELGAASWGFEKEHTPDMHALRRSHFNVCKPYRDLLPGQSWPL